MTVEAIQEHSGQPQGQDNAAASELAASAAQLRLLMQKLIANRSHGDSRQDERALQVPQQLRNEQSAESVSSMQHGEASASVFDSTAAVQRGSHRTPNTEAAQQQQAACATPGMTSLAAQARELLQEIETAAAASPALSQTASPKFAHLVASGARRVLAFPSDQQQSRLAVQSSDVLSQQAEDFACEQPGSITTDGATCIGGTEPSLQHLANTGARLPVASMSLADSNTWSMALQQYQLHQQQSAALLQQQARTADSCSSSSKQPAPAAAADGTCFADDTTSAAPNQGFARITEVVDLQPKLPAAAPAATSAASMLAARLASASSVLQPSVAAANRLINVHQQTQQPQTDVGATVGGFIAAKQSFEEQLSPDSVRLRVKALRGPLEDAMRCFSELQEAREEVSLLRARNSRLTAAEESWQSERGYLLIERKLQAAQLRQLAVLLAADTGKSACSVVSSQEAAQQQVSDSEQQLETQWRLLPADLRLRLTSGPSQVAHDFAVVTTEVEAAIRRRQQQVDQLSQQLKDTQTELLQQQHQAEQLQQQLITVQQAADVAAQQEVAGILARSEKKVLRAEQKLLKLVSRLLLLWCLLEGWMVMLSCVLDSVCIRWVHCCSADKE